MPHRAAAEFKIPNATTCQTAPVSKQFRVVECELRNLRKSDEMASIPSPTFSLQIRCYVNAVERDAKIFETPGVFECQSRALAGSARLQTPYSW
jgi:hypothetical protein